MNGARSTTAGTSDVTMNIDATRPLLVDRRGAGRMLGVSAGTIDNLRLRGQLPSVKLGARRLYDVEDLHRLIAAKKAVSQ